MEGQSFANVWDAIEDTPAEAARRLGITQAQLNDLLRGRVAKFDTDTLIKLATQAGLALRLDITEAA